MLTLAEADPKNLIREGYRIDGIDLPQCRALFIDWALSLKPDQEAQPALTRLLEEYAAAHPDHPLTGVLRAAQQAAAPPKRRGGRAGRLG